MIVITQLMGYSPNLPKNNKNKIKRADIGRKINLKNWLFSSPIASLLSQKIEESTNLRKNIIYHWINLCKNKSNDIIIFFIGQFDLIMGQLKV